MRAILSALSMLHQTPRLVTNTLALVKLASRNIENRLFAEQFCDSSILMFHARHEYLPTTSVAMIALMITASLKAQITNAKSMLKTV